MTDADSSIQKVIVGTAGHIDHGKSSLVIRLTGVDPDRLQEEKERGMTIDLGFARYESAGGKLVGIIDVPGHERFIKNMVAGATSVDVVVLVVAADDGVMPQTREHLDILTLLGADSGMVALTKSDLVDEELLEMAREDVRLLLRDTFLEEAAIIACSNSSGAGIEEVRQELERLIAATPARDEGGLFRLPIQRVFSARGHGTVITGVPVSGEIHVGDEVEVLPLGQSGRVRGIQAYGQACERALAGHSCALNVGDVDYRLVHRGMVAGSPGCFRPSQLLEARLQYLSSRKKPLKHRTEVRVHVGTAEVMGRVRIVDQEMLMPGEEGLVQLELVDPVVVGPRDRFLIRQASPMLTIGGGTLFGTSVRHRKRLRDHHVQELQEREQALASPEDELLFAARSRRLEPFDVETLAVDVGSPVPETEKVAAALLKTGGLVDVGRGQMLSKEFFEHARQEVMQGLKALHKAHPLKKLIEVRDLRSRVSLPESVFKATVQTLANQGAVSEEGAAGQLRLSSHQPALSDKEDKLLGGLRSRLTDGELSPPSLKVIAEELGGEPGLLTRLANLLCDEGELVRVGAHYFSQAAVARAREELIANGRKNDAAIDIPALRDILSTSRKYMIPLLEYFDAQGITVRRGDKRFLRESKV